MDEITLYLILVALALVILIVIVFELGKVKVLQKGIHYSNSKLTLSHGGGTLCLSPDCIRCTRNQDILQNALTKLSYCAEMYNNEDGVNETEALTLDIKKSIKQFKSGDQNYFDGPEINASSSIKSSTPVVLKLTGLREEDVWSSSDFPALQILDRYFKNISLEFNNLYKSPLIEIQCLWKTNVTPNGKWQIVQLIDQGKRTKVAGLCPITMEVLLKIPYFMQGNMFGDASFSVLDPGTEISTHCGSTNARIRCHLGLKVPEGECYLQVGDKTCHWKQGKVICFNDAFPHSVHHKAGNNSGIRAVFMFDIWHPDISESQRKLLNFAFGI